MSSSKYRKLREALYLKYPKGTCPVCLLQDAELRSAIEKLLAEGFGGQSISSALATMGLELTKHALERHGTKCMKKKNSSGKSRA